jgi:hypothetical protein
MNPDRGTPKRAAEGPMRDARRPILILTGSAADSPSRAPLAASLPATAPAGDRPCLASETILKNRRQWARYTPVVDAILVGWWSGDDFRIVGARMVNIGRGGVMISIAASPDQGQPVWLRLVGSVGSESLKAVVLESKWTLVQRRYTVRLAFPHTCPDDFFEAAVHGRPLPEC